MRTLVYSFPHLLISGIFRTFIAGAVAYFLLRIATRIFRHSNFKYQLSNLALLTTTIAFIQPFFSAIVQILKRHNNSLNTATAAHEYTQSQSAPNIYIAPAGSTGSYNLLNSFISILEQHEKFILFIYIAGLLFFSFRLFWGYYYITQLRKDTIPIDEGWLNILVKAKQKLNIKYPVQLSFTRRTISPCIVGYSKALILIPLSLANNITTEQAEAILLHELTHLKQYDYYINLVTQLLQCLLFFNPFSWFITRQCNLYREMSCDDAAKTHGLNIALAESIGIIAGMQFNDSNIALNLKANRSALIRRVDNLLSSGRSNTYKNSSTVFGALSLLLTAAFVICCTTKSLSQPKNLNTRLEEISTEMFNEGNEKFIVVDAIKDSLLVAGKPYNILYMSDDNLFISGHGLPWKGYKKAMDQAMSKQLKATYIEKIQRFRAKMGENPNGVLDIGPRKNQGVTIQGILDPNSDFRRINLEDRYRAGIRTEPIRKMIHHLIDDRLANPDDSSIVYSFDRDDIVFNHKKLQGELKARYQHYIEGEMGIDLQYDGESGVWGRLCKLSEF
ncbi:MAG: M56 family metallopeptidase [Flavipsychrobacter sp.]